MGEGEPAVDKGWVRTTFIMVRRGLGWLGGLITFALDWIGRLGSGSAYFDSHAWSLGKAVGHWLSIRRFICWCEEWAEVVLGREGDGAEAGRGNGLNGMKIWTDDENSKIQI